eukprot:3398101-Pyramimonas_sp.AAC.1
MRLRRRICFRGEVLPGKADAHSCLYDVPCGLRMWERPECCTRLAQLDHHDDPESSDRGGVQGATIAAEEGAS